MEKTLAEIVEERVKRGELEIVEITWVDSSHNNYGWHEADDSRYNLVPITTVGYLLVEYEDRVVTTMSVGEQALVFDAFVIPRGCIRNITRIARVGVKTT